MEWRSAETPEHRYSNQNRLRSFGRRRMSSREAHDLHRPFPLGRYRIAAVMPWIGNNVWISAATASEADLGRYLRTEDPKLKWAAIAEVAFRRSQALAPELEALAAEGWAPAAFALSEIRADNTNLARRLVTSRHGSVRLWAAYTLAVEGNAAGRSTLWQYLRAEQRVHRPDRGLTRTDVARALLPFEANDRDRLLELCALSQTHRFTQHLGRLGTPAATEALVRLASESDYHSKYQWAIMSLALGQDPMHHLRRIEKTANADGARRAATEAIDNLKSGLTPDLTENRARWVRAGAAPIAPKGD